MKLLKFPIKMLKREKKEEEIEENMYELLKKKEIFLKALEINRKKFPEFEGIHEFVLHKDRHWNLVQLLKNIDNLKQLNLKIKKMEDEFLRFEEKDIEAVKHFDKLMVEDEDEFKKLIKFHDKNVKFSGKHKKILQSISFKDNIYENEKKALVNLLYVMKYVHDDVLKLKKIIKEEDKILKRNSKEFKKLKEASEDKIKKIDSNHKIMILSVVRELMIEVKEEIGLVKKLKSHFEVEEGRVGILKNLENERIQLKAV